MAQSVCPRCGGCLDIERETRRPLDGTVETVFVCHSCGARSILEGHRGSAATDRRASACGAWLWVVAALTVLWFVLRFGSYGGTRSRLYDLVASGGEAYRHPAALAVLIAAAALLFLARHRRRSTSDAVRGASTADLHLRAEPAGNITMVLPDSRGAMGRDIVVPFREADVAELLRRFDELARRSATSGARVGDEAGELRALGERLGEALLGGDGEAARLISRIPADRLMIRLQKDLVHIPWELIVTRAGGQYLWQSFGLSRQLRTAAGESGTASQLKAPLHVLLLANLEAGVPGRDLPAAEREAAEIMDLGAKNPELMRVTRKSPQTAAELSALLGQEFDVIHYASHASYAGEGRTGWVLPDGSVLTGRELQSLNGRVPSLVFANACNVSGPTGLVESRSGDLAETFLTWGVSAYLGTLWEVSDAAGADFARVFYRCLLGGEALADCINTARAALLRGAGIAWANYVLYGDPELRLTAAGRD